MGAAGESRGCLHTLPNRHRPKPSDNRKAMLGKLSERIGSLESLGSLGKIGKLEKIGKIGSLENLGALGILRNLTNEPIVPKLFNSLN